MKPQHPAALLCDLDGTLVDTEPLHWRSAQEVLAGCGVTLPDADEALYRGFAEVAFFEALARRYRLTAPITSLATRRTRAFLGALTSESAPLMPGAARMLQRAADRQLPVAIASAAPKLQIEAVALFTGLDRAISVRVSGHDDVAHSKPLPDVYRLAAARLGVRPKDCWALEDSVNGARSAVASGARVFVVHADNQEAFAGLEVEQIASLDDLPLP